MRARAQSALLIHFLRSIHFVPRNIKVAARQASDLNVTLQMRTRHFYPTVERLVSVSGSEYRAASFPPRLSRKVRPEFIRGAVSTSIFSGSLGERGSIPTNELSRTCTLRACVSVEDISGCYQRFVVPFQVARRHVPKLIR